MPKPVNLHDRPTKDLHASWWSDETDKSGRYIERAVIYAQLLQVDANRVSERVGKNITISKAQVDQIQAGNLDDIELDLGDPEAQKRALFEVMCVAVYDDEGNEYPGHVQNTFEGLEQRDVNFILEAVNSLGMALVKPTMLDAEMASVSGKSAQDLAEGNFRGRSQKAATRR